MKRKSLLLGLILTVSLLAGCCLSHDWEEAACEAPKTCTKCQETEGEALGHSWAEATCEEPETCTACGKAQGQALGHSWAEATCEASKTCTACTAVEGEALAHIVETGIVQENEATGEVTYAGACSLCSAEVQTAYPSMEDMVGQWLAGKWVPNLISFQENGVYSTDEFYTFPTSMTEDYFLFTGESNQVELVYGGTYYTGTWLLSDIYNKEDTFMATVTLSTGGGYLVTMLNSPSRYGWQNNGAIYIYLPEEMMTP